MSIRRLTGAIAVASLVFAACADDDERSSPTGTQAASTDPATADPATTDPSATDPPGTDAPTTEPVATDAPSTDPPTTDAPTTDPPTTDPADDQPTAPLYDFGEVDAAVADFVEERGLDGAGLIVVHRDDGVIHHEHWGEFSEDHISLVASSTKMVTAGVLLRLQDDGLLDVDAPVADVVEWGSANPDITPAQLLSNSSGLPGLLSVHTGSTYLCQFLFPVTLRECAEQIFTTGDDDADVIAPDTAFRYGGGQWQVAGAVAEVASGRSWDELIEEIYVEPCGLEALGYNNHFAQLGDIGFAYPTDFDSDPSQLAATANPNMEAGMYVTTGDYGKLLLMHLRGGMCGDEQVLSQAALDVMHADRIGEVYGGTTDADSGYGMGWWVDRDTGRITDPGAYGSVPWLDLDAGYGAYLVIEDDTETGQALADTLFDLVDDAITG